MSTQDKANIVGKDNGSGECGSSIVVASDEEQTSRLPRHSVPTSGNCSSSSSSEDEEGYASPPPNKRRKYKHNVISDPRIDGLINQVSYISGYLSQLPFTINRNTSCTEDLILPGPSKGFNQSQYLTNPCSSSDMFTLGELNTDFDERKVVPPAKKERLDKLNNLQHFDTQAWKGMRYKSVLQTYSATPGFVSLKVNEEFCHLNKTKDYLASAENVLAGLTNAELEQQELLKQGLQDLLNWAAGNPDNINPNSLFEKITVLLGPGSPLHKCSEKIMQIICGRRGESIEIRRERIIKEINNPNLKATLRGIPPSSEHLFSRDALQPVIKSLGGTQLWLNKPEYIKEGKTNRMFSNKNERRVHSNSHNKNSRFDDKQLKSDNIQTSHKRHNFRKNFHKKRNSDQNTKQK